MKKSNFDLTSFSQNTYQTFITYELTSADMNCKIIQDNITGPSYHSFEELNKHLDDIQPQIAVVEETPRDVKKHGSEEVHS